MHQDSTFRKFSSGWYCPVKISLSYHWLGDSNMKLLQVVLLKNSFLKTFGEGKGDLNTFNSSKLVHVLTLKTFTSGVF
jgi:hypothetical protein